MSFDQIYCRIHMECYIHFVGLVNLVRNMQEIQQFGSDTILLGVGIAAAGIIAIVMQGEVNEYRQNCCKY